MTIAIGIFMILGVFFAAIGTIGILRMPDVFGRLQASTCIATLSTFCSSLAGILYVIDNRENFASVSTIVKLVLFILLVIVTNPISNHALCKAAYRTGVKPGKGLIIDDYKADFGEAKDIEGKADLPDADFDLPYDPDGMANANEPIPEPAEVTPAGAPVIEYASSVTGKTNNNGEASK
jgi:multicomponent Na+:H+ antiporter subunit G